MAEFGLRYPCFKKHDKSTGVVLGKAVTANRTVNLASGELYGDDVLAEQLAEFVSGSIAMETDNLADRIASEIYGAKVTNGVVTYNKDDTAPEGVLGYYKVLMVKGVKKYRAYVYPRAKAAIGNDNGQTKGSSITFQTAQTTFTIFADDLGDWMHTHECSTAAEAKAYVDSYCGTGGSDDEEGADCRLAALTIGTLRLDPNFDPYVEEYEATATAASNVVTAIANDEDASVEITQGESTEVTNGAAVTFTEGENVLSIVVTNGSATKTYVVTVTYSA